MATVLQYLGNIRGPQGYTGATGSQGLSGTNGDTADNAVASFVATLGTSATKAALDAKYAPITSGLQDFLGLIRMNNQDVNMLICSDSTAEMASSWIKQAAPMIAALFPTHQVKIRDIVTGTPPTWGSSTIYGSGTYTITIWNSSVAGMSWEYNMDINRREPMIVQPKPDVVIFSYGHNENYALAQVGNMQTGHDKMVACVESIRSFIPDTAVVMMSQNPLTGTDRDKASQYRSAMYRRYALNRGYGFINICQAFFDDGRVIADTLVSADKVHPTTAGHLLWANEFMRHLRGSNTSQVMPMQPPAFSQGGRNYITNSTLRLTTGALPDWTLNNLTVTSYTGFSEVTSSSLKLTNISASLGYMDFPLPINAFRGQYVTFAVRMYIPSGSPSGAGRVGLITSDDTYFSDLWTGTRGQWFWRTVTGRVQPFSTTVKVQIGVTTSAEASTVYVDRASVVIGTSPADV